MNIDNPDITKTERLGFLTEPDISFYCKVCGEPIFCGEEYFDILSVKVCRFCVRKETAL